MADTIETFVAKLQTEGVQAGQAKAEKLQADAQATAEKTIADAQAKAKQILADAEKEADSRLHRAQSEMQLAARDTVAQLRRTLTSCLSLILGETAREALGNVEFIGNILHEVVRLYTQADHEQKSLVKINVQPEMRQKLVDWALKELGQELANGRHPAIDLKGKLRQAGFEYEIDDRGTVEVTQESVVETLSGMVTPALRDLLTQTGDAKAE